jgi:hypothetical protein
MAPPPVRPATLDGSLLSCQEGVPLAGFPASLLRFDPECQVGPAVLARVVEAAVFEQRPLGFGGGEGCGWLPDPGAVRGMDGDAGRLARLAFGFGDVAGDGAGLLLDLLDPAPGVLQLPGEPGFDGPEFGEALDGRQVGHVFECRGGVAGWHPGGVDRYHLTLTAAGRPAMHGWWSSEVTARGKFAAWVGSWGVPGAQIVLVDEETGETLAEWPGIVSAGS